jgi:hypothetical protein
MARLNWLWKIPPPFCHSERSEESLFLFIDHIEERFLASLEMTKSIPSSAACGAVPHLELQLPNGF